MYTENVRRSGSSSPHPSLATPTASLYSDFSRLRIPERSLFNGQSIATAFFGISFGLAIASLKDVITPGNSGYVKYLFYSSVGVLVLSAIAIFYFARQNYRAGAEAISIL